MTVGTETQHPADEAKLARISHRPIAFSDIHRDEMRIPYAGRIMGFVLRMGVYAQSGKPDIRMVNIQRISGVDGE